MATEAATNPFTTAALVAVIIGMAGFIVRLYQYLIADKDRQIAELKSELKEMAAGSTSLARSSEKMLDYFLERPAPRDDETTTRGGHPP